MMAHRKNQTLILFSLLLLLIPIFCEATDQHATETEEASSGEGEILPPVHRPGYGASPDEGPEGEESVSAVSQHPAAAAAEEEEEEEEEEVVQPSTPSSVAAVGTDNSNHLPREPDLEEGESEEEDDSEENDSEEHEVEESDELTTVLAVSSSSVPLAPIPPEDHDEAGHQDGHSSPNDETLRPEPSKTVVIWDGTSEPDREVPINEAEQPVLKSEDKPVNQSEQPHSEELHGGANGNGQTKENESNGEDKSNSEVKTQEDRPGGKPEPVISTGSTSSSSMAWVVVFAVVSAALLISGVILGIVIVTNRSKRKKTSKVAAMYESESDRDSSCHFGCRHNFDDFNPYAWPPTPVRRNETTLRPIT